MYKFYAIIQIMYSLCIDMKTDTTNNSDELPFYKVLSAFWWDQSGPFWPLHRQNQFRVAWILEQCCSYFSRSPSAQFQFTRNTRVNYMLVVSHTGAAD